MFEETMSEERPTNFWHWLGPILSAVVSVIAIATIVFYTGSAAQRLTVIEEKVGQINSTTADGAVKRVEIQYRLDNIDSTLKEIKGDVKDLQKRK